MVIFYEPSCVGPRRSPAALCVGPRHCVCPLCRTPALSVSGPNDFSVLGARRSTSGPGALCVGLRRSLCRRSLCRNALLSVSGPALYVSGPSAALSVSGPGALCVGARRSLRRSLCQAPLSVLEPGVSRSLCRAPPLSRSLCWARPAAQIRVSAGPSSDPHVTHLVRRPTFRSACHPSDLRATHVRVHIIARRLKTRFEDPCREAWAS